MVTVVHYQHKFHKVIRRVGIHVSCITDDMIVVFFAISANLPTQEHLSISRPYVLQQIDFFRTLALIYGSVACYRN